MTKQEIYDELTRIARILPRFELRTEIVALKNRMRNDEMECESESRESRPILALQHLIGTLKIYIEPSLPGRTEPALHQTSQCKHCQEESSRVSAEVLKTLRSIIDDPSL